MISARARLRERAYHITKYPRCWKRASRAIRRLACGVCQKCGQPSEFLEVHHIGASYADGRPGDSNDKHDIRQENLTAICIACHDELEQVRAIRNTKREKRKRRAARREAHRASGVGTGLVPIEEYRTEVIAPARVLTPGSQALSYSAPFWLEILRAANRAVVVASVWQNSMEVPAWKM